jgi:hypothetical protein
MVKGMHKQLALAMLLTTWACTVLFAQTDADCVRFRNRKFYNTTVGGGFVRTADLNGDSNRDFVVAGDLGFIAIFYGAGRFRAPAIFPARVYPYDVALRDFNGDLLSRHAPAKSTSFLAS